MSNFLDEMESWNKMNFDIIWTCCIVLQMLQIKFLDNYKEHGQIEIFTGIEQLRKYSLFDCGKLPKSKKSFPCIITS